jgi:ABC-type transporter Mla subunit MlaD
MVDTLLILTTIAVLWLVFVLVVSLLTIGISLRRTVRTLRELNAALSGVRDGTAPLADLLGAAADNIAQVDRRVAAIRGNLAAVLKER